MEIEKLYEIFLKFPSIQTDSRKIQKKDLFFALKGNNFNGNQFALECLEKGAEYAIVDENIENIHPNIIKVENVLQTLQDLAKYHRQQFKIPFIAITGSNGKTTTKELMATVLSTSYKTDYTQGNLNNHIGIPLTILSIRKDAEMAIIEMGANHLHEIASYCLYTLPTHGIITNCGKAHLEGFGSEIGVQKGKSELFSFLSKEQQPIFINEEETYLLNLTYNNKNIVLYNGKNSIVQGKVIKNDVFLKIEIKIDAQILNVQTNLIGVYNLSNCLAAACIGNYFKVPAEKIKFALESYQPSNQRSQFIKWKNHNVYLDAYNANPSSMRKAIENFASADLKHKILFLGAMKELGSYTQKEHQALIHLINEYSWDFVALVGKEFENCTHTYSYFDDVFSLKKYLITHELENSSTILIKGSRSTKMEKLLEKE